MRYIVYGAGAIGGAIAGRLHGAGHDVSVIARGDHLRALRDDGLVLRSPDGEVTHRFAVHEDPADLEIGADDLVILSMKSQDTLPALDRLIACCRELPAICCAQNGVENERVALRRFPRVYGMFVYLSAEHLEPGVVRTFASPVAGVLDVGSYPSGSDELARRLAADLTATGLDSRAVDDIMRFKYAKLLNNLANVLEVVCGRDPTGQTWRGRSSFHRLREEAHACYRAAEIDFASAEEVLERVSVISPKQRVAGSTGSNSTAQSISRGKRRLEVDYINGEIVMLGGLHNVATPANALLQRLANEVADQRRPVECPSIDDLDALTAGAAEPAPKRGLLCNRGARI